MSTPLSIGSLPKGDECIAVLPFEIRYDLGSSSETISELLALELYRQGAHGVAAPMEVAKIFRQANEPLPAVIDPYWARTIGKKLGVDAVVFGSVARLPILQGHRDEGGKYVLDGKDGAERGSIHLNVDAYLAEVSTGEIRWTFGIKEIVPQEDYVAKISSFAEAMSRSLLVHRQGNAPFGRRECWKGELTRGPVSPPESKAPTAAAVPTAIPSVSAITAVPLAPNPPPSAPLSSMERKVAKALATKDGLRLDSAAFEGRGDRLTSLARPKLDALAALMGRPEGPAFIEVGGHVDATENNPEDLDVSRWRAEAVKKYLEEKGVDAARMKAAGYGGTKPILPNMNIRSRNRNRRIEIYPVSPRKP